MKRFLDNKVIQIGITAFVVIACAIILAFCLGHLSIIFGFFGRIIKILMPLIYGLVLAYIMNPIVNLLENKLFTKIKSNVVKRNLSIFCTLVFLISILAALISVVIPELLTSIQNLIVNIPNYIKDIEAFIVSWLSDNGELEQTVLNNYDIVSNYIMNATNNVIGPMADSAVNKLSSGIFGIFSFVFNFAIGTVFAVYILANTKNFASGIRKTLYSFFNTTKVDNFIADVKHVNNIFLHFMIGKICDSSLVALLTFLFLIIFKFPYPLLIAVIIGLTDLIPYFGPYIGSIPSALLICLVSPVKAITFILFMIVLQQIDGNLITPRIQKQATGLPSFWVLFAITLFGGLFGVVGMIIGVPCFTIIYEIAVEHIDKRLKRKNLPVETTYYENNSDKVKKRKNKESLASK